jgi:hypothetical protein
MQGRTDEAPIPTKYVIDSRILGVTMRRKIGQRTYPWPATAAGSPALPPPREDEVAIFPAAKKPRLQAPTTSNGVTTDSPDDTPTDPVTPAVSLPSATASYAPRRIWNAEEDEVLTEAVKKHGKDWVAVAKLVPGRTHNQCRHRWLHSLDHANGGNQRKTPYKYWKSEEDGKLTEGVKKRGKKWVAVAAIVPGRTNVQCRHRWLQSLDTDRASNTVEEEHNAKF